MDKETERQGRAMTRDEAIKILQEEINGNLELTLIEWQERDEQKLFPALRMAIEALQSEPVKHGEWIEAKWVDLNDWTTWRECSCCGESLSKYVEGFGRRDFPQLNYCPNCGAKMTGGDET